MIFPSSSSKKAKSPALLSSKKLIDEPQDACACAVRGKCTPHSLKTICTKPAASMPKGVLPPAKKGTLMYSLAVATTLGWGARWVDCEVCNK